ncbi:MAG TPA: branched-chain amino acid ABC transporter permease [Rubrivivax sp.]|nr:branched-chain amino acid ABC transporter permease [Rubrivivax sp.]
MSPNREHFAGQSRWGGWEVAFWLAWVVAFFVPQMNLALMTQILIWGLFAVSLDLLLGYRGLPSFGQAAFFGIGAYTAGFLGKLGWTEPISGLVLSAAAAGIVGLGAGRLVRGVHGVALLMVTLGLNSLLFDLVQRSTELTGGDDGLPGVSVAPVLGLFRFDMVGRTGYLYTLAACCVVFVLLRALINSPYGLALRGARDNPRRMRMLGAPIDRDLSWVMALSAAVAGVAGALLTQTTQFVAPDVLSFQRSADVLVILVIGGTGLLYGGFVGALVFIFLRDLFAALNPVYWYFWIGLLLVLTVTFFRRGLLPALAGWYASRRLPLRSGPPREVAR